MRSLPKLVLLVALAAVSAHADDAAPVNAGTDSSQTLQSWPTQDELMLGAAIPDLLAHDTWGISTPGRLAILRDHGFQWVQVRLLTRTSPVLRATPVSQWKTLTWQDAFWSSLEYATESMRRAQEEGFRLNLLLFFSDSAAWPCRQDRPPEWRDMGIEDLEHAVEDYCMGSARHLDEEGLRVDLYTLGNEIELGILNTEDEAANPGECLPERVWRTEHPYYTTTYLREAVWPDEARLLRAAIRGIRAVDADARFALHVNSLGRSPDGLLERDFFKSMKALGVNYDYASLTYPDVNWKADFTESARSASPYYRTDEFLGTVQEIASLGVDILVGEFLYPHSPAGIRGQPDPGYPFSPAGQARWIKDFLANLDNIEELAGCFYYSPDWFPGVSGGDVLVHESSGLFRTATEQQPAMEEFRAFGDSP